MLNHVYCRDRFCIVGNCWCLQIILLILEKALNDSDDEYDEEGLQYVDMLKKRVCLLNIF